MNHSLGTELNLRLIVIFVFFVALAFGARRRMLSVKDLIVAGAILCCASAIMIFDSALKVTFSIFGRDQKAFTVAGGYAAIFVLSLVVALTIMVRRMKRDELTLPQAKVSGKKSRAVLTVADNSNTPKPKPVRAKGSRRRF